uniref:Uncharacterized protein n=1 Tax=viral metagenome TaxID=1070528 RepID=A0A6C0E1J4_9ZZZZ
MSSKKPSLPKISRIIRNMQIGNLSIPREYDKSLEKYLINEETRLREIFTRHPDRDFISFTNPEILNSTLPKSQMSLTKREMVVDKLNKILYKHPLYTSRSRRSRRNRRSPIRRQSRRSRRSPIRRQSSESE